MLKEFKEFAVKGNMMDLAIGVIIGGAFGAVVNSLVNNVLMPVIGLATGGVNFADKAITLKEAGADGKPVLLQYGIFINLVITFIIVAFACFMMVKAMNKMRRQQEEAPAPDPEPSAEEKLLTEIRDLLKAKG